MEKKSLTQTNMKEIEKLAEEAKTFEEFTKMPRIDFYEEHSSKELWQQAMEVLCKIMPPDVHGENEDCEELQNIILELGYRADKMQKSHVEAYQKAMEAQKQPAMSLEECTHSHSDCREESGIKIGLIDSIISISRVLRPLLNEIDDNVYQALKDLHNDEDILSVLKSGPHNIHLKRTNNKYLLEVLDNMGYEQILEFLANKYGHLNFSTFKNKCRKDADPLHDMLPFLKEVAELYANQFREDKKWVSVDSPYELMPAGLYLIQAKHPVTEKLSISPILIKSLSRFPLGYETAYCKLEYPSPPNKEG